QQNIYHRWIEGRTPQHCEKLLELAPAIKAAIEAEQRNRTDLHSSVANTNRECIEATSAKLTGQPQSIVRKEAIEAINELANLADLTVHITS
ncbi:toxin YdaT domain-containing protein, partial [Salmonella enterica subsp. enterica serovar Typhimurium]